MQGPDTINASAVRILEAVAASAERIMAERHWQRAMSEVLQMLGTAAGASRAFMFRNHRDPDGSLLTSQVAEWTAYGIRSFKDAPHLQDMNWVGSGYSRWMDLLSRGEAVHGIIDDFPVEERPELESEAVVSTLNVPIFADEEWWGCIGFDDCIRERQWDEGEIQALRSAAGVIGAAVLRERAEDQYRALVETLPLITYRESGGPSRDSVELRYLSPQAEQVLGYPVERWRDGTFWPSILNPDDRRAVLDEDGETLAIPQPFDMEYRVTAADGRTVWINDRAIPVVDEHGEVSYWQGFMLDVTRRKEAEALLAAAEERYRFLVERGPLGTYLLQYPQVPVLQPVYLSPQFEEIFGYPMGRWHEQGFWESIVHPDDRDVLEAEDRRAIVDGDFDLEYRMLAADGRVVWIHDTAEVIVEEGKELWKGYVSDVTARHEALEEREAAIEQERLAKREIEDVSDLKDVMLQAVSHDIRTPLTAILGMAVTLTQPDVDLTEEERRDFAQRIATNTTRLDRLVADLLDLDKLSRGELYADLRAVDLSAIAKDVVAYAQPQGRQLALETEITVVQADTSKVERIIDNLIGNAAKHTPAGAHIWVRVRPTEGGGLILVEDDGGGVPDADRESIFDVYRRGSGAPGSGLGLSLVRRFAELHGGRAWVAERPGGGASFRVWLPEAPRG